MDRNTMSNTKAESVGSGQSDPTTIFAKILAGEMPGSFVYRDELVSAFMDIQPVNFGHVLVVPNRPVREFSALDEDTAAHLLRVAHRVAKAIRATDIRCEGINLFLAEGTAAGQEVFHVHLHVFPRFSNDGFGFKYGAQNFQFQAREALDKAAAKIAQALQENATI